MDRAASFKRFYLYSALSIAVLAASFGVTALIARSLEFAGLALRTPSDDDLRRTVSFALAVLVFAVPIGALHLALIRRSLGDPVEAAADARHFYLNAWVAVAILVVMGAAGLIAQNVLDGSRDLATPLAFLIVALAVGVVAWRWRAATPARTAFWEASWGAVVLAAAMLMVAGSVGSGVSALARLLTEQPAGPGGPFAPDGRLPPYSGTWADLQARVAWNAAAQAAIALATWAFAARWQRGVPSAPLRRLYLIGAYTVGLGLLSFGAINGLELATSPGATLRSVTGPWPFMAIGLLLVPLHALALRRESATWGVPRGYVVQMLAAIPALFGLVQLVVGLVLWWQLVVEVVLLGRPGTFGAGPRAAGYTLVGGLLYGAASYALARSTRDSPRAEPRRFYLYTVICLALLATVIAGATTVYNVLIPLLGVSERGSGDRALEWSVPTLIGALVFATHLIVLRRDARAAAAGSVAPPPAARPIAEDLAAPTDPLVRLLADVRDGRVAVADAAARIRGGL